MDLEKSRRKRSSSILKKLVHSLSFPKGKLQSSKSSSTISLSKSKSWHSTTTTTTKTHLDHHRPEKSPPGSWTSRSPYSQLNNLFTSKTSRTHHRHHNRHTPNGCFCVYVGEERKRFIIKTKYANHPLFKMLLEDAETEYGFNSEGPLLLPCDVDLFYKVLAEMDHNDGDGGDGSEEIVNIGCGSSSSCSPFSPARRLAGNGKSNAAMAANNSYSPYALLTPPRLLKINNRSPI